MSDHVYRLSEIVGSSETSVDEAIRTAVRRAAQTVRNIEWFQTQEIVATSSRATSSTSRSR